jgi:hypothetical protein
LKPLKASSVETGCFFSHSSSDLQQTPEQSIRRFKLSLSRRDSTNLSNAMNWVVPQTIDIAPELLSGIDSIAPSSVDPMSLRA